MSPSLFIRTFTSHWRAAVILFVGLLLVGALAAGLPAYATTVAGQGLTQRLADAPFAARNILISGNGLNEPLYERIRTTLGDLLVDRVEVREIEVSGSPVIFTAAGDRSFDEFFALHPYAVTDLERRVSVLDGRLPQANADIIEAVIGRDAATTLNFSTADGSSVERYNLTDR